MTIAELRRIIRRMPGKATIEVHVKPDRGANHLVHELSAGRFKDIFGRPTLTITARDRDDVY